MATEEATAAASGSLTRNSTGGVDPATMQTPLNEASPARGDEAGCLSGAAVAPPPAEPLQGQRRWA